METITIQGKQGFIAITFDEVYGFPNSTCHWGGYETRSTIKIKSGNFQVSSTLWTSTGELFEFYLKLKECNKNLTGIAKFKSYEGCLELEAAYDSLGHANFKGEFSELNHLGNLLKFEFESDQTYIKNTISDFELIAEKYGGMQGVKK